jgi:hypothetical protein
MVLSLILRTERSIDILLRKVDHIEQIQEQIQEQMVQQGQMTTSPYSESTVASSVSDGRLPQPVVDVPHPVLVGDRLGAHPARLELDTYLALTQNATREVGVTNDNPFWFSMATDPIPIHIPQPVNPLFENKARAAEYH